MTLLGCGPSPGPATGPVSVTIDGAPTTFPTATGYYWTMLGATVILAAPGMVPSIGLLFPGLTTGTFTCSPTSPVVIDYYDAGGNDYRTSMSQGSCSIAVTSYGAVGEPIAGTFSGSLVRGGVTLTVSGSFQVVRSADR